MAAEPDAAWARAHAPDLPLAAMSDLDFDQYHFRRTRELQTEAAAEEQALLRELALLRQRLSKRITDQLRQLGDDRQLQKAELRKRHAEAQQKELLGGRGNGYGIEEAEEETPEEAEEKGKERKRLAEEERERVRAMVVAAEAEARRRREEAEAAQAEARRRVNELAARRKREEEELRRYKMRERRMREEQAGWRVRVINLEVANNIRYVDVPWPITTTSITSQAAINAHLSHITPSAVRTFLDGVAEIDLEQQDRKDAAFSPNDTTSSFTGSSSSKVEWDETADRLETARRRAVRDAIRIFHPDKFYNRVLPRVRQAERGKVREGVERTSRVLNDLLATIG